MKRTTKVFWSMCGALVVMGSIFMTAGAVMGASRSVQIGKNWGVHFDGWGAGSNDYHIDEQSLPAFQKIDISVIAADIAVVQSDHYGLKLDLDGRDNKTELIWSVSDGVLKVQERREESYFGWFDPAFLFSFVSEWGQRGESFPRGEVFVYLPAGTQMERIGLATVEGELTASGLQTKRFASSTVAGDTKLWDCRLDSVSLSSVDGDIDVKDSHLGHATIDTISDDVNLEGVTTDSFAYNAVDADLYFRGKPLGETEITGISGDVEFEIDGNREDYWIENSENRKVKIYDDSKKQEKKASEHPNRITISTMGGECTIRFR